MPGENHQLAETGTQARIVMLEVEFNAGLAALVALVALAFICPLNGDQASGLSTVDLGYNDIDIPQGQIVISKLSFYRENA